MTGASTNIMWFRRDLRLGDNPALCAAAASSSAVLPVFVVDQRMMASAGARSERLMASLAALQRDVGGALIVRSGEPAEVMAELTAEVGAQEVHVTGETAPYGRRRDAAVGARLAATGCRLVATGSPYAVTPGRVRTASGTPFRIFTPFSREWKAHGWREPAERPDVTWAAGPESERLDHPPEVPAGEDVALKGWRAYLERDLDGYQELRDRPDLDRTSRMSIPLKYGEIHPRTLLADLRRHREGGDPVGIDRFQAELAWREFYADVLWHAPRSRWRDWNEDVGHVQYDEDTDLMAAWREGRTGYPLVDAGMRQLLSEGWMHNRVRMVCASFLVKDLHVWWPHGARHFLRHLLDGDLASNNHGWQWVAGTGTDAAPYFRVFNPVTQGKRFDPEGDYVRRWVAELRHLQGPDAHEPWRHPGGYVHGYPQRVVDHAEERRVALERWAHRHG